MDRLKTITTAAVVRITPRSSPPNDAPKIDSMLAFSCNIRMQYMQYKNAVYAINIKEWTITSMQVEVSHAKILVKMV